MPQFQPEELILVFKNIQQTIQSRSESIEADSLSEACVMVLHSFLNFRDVQISETDKVNKIITLLQEERSDLQEMGLTLLQTLDSKEIWNKIVNGFQHHPNNCDDCFTHQMYRVTLGMLRAWAENPFANHSNIKSLKLRADFLDDHRNIAFVRHFTDLESLNLDYMNHLSSLEGLESSTKLITLNAQSTEISDLRGLKNNPNLQVINIKGSSVTSLNGLHTTHANLSIDARKTPLMDVSAIPENTDVYLCVDKLPSVGSTTVTYLRCAEEWLPDISQFPNIHTIYLEKPLYSLNGLIALKHLKNVFVRYGGWNKLLNGALLTEAYSVNIQTWSRHNIMFGDDFSSISTEDWDAICKKIQTIEAQSTRTFHTCDDRLWSHCQENITSVCLLSSGTTKGIMDCTALTTLTNLKEVILELSLRTPTLEIILPPLRNISQIIWTGCSKQRNQWKTRQYLQGVDIKNPVHVTSLVIRDFPALKNNFLRDFPLKMFPHLKEVRIERCPKLSKRMAKKLFKDVELTME